MREEAAGYALAGPEAGADGFQQLLLTSPCFSLTTYSWGHVSR